MIQAVKKAKWQRNIHLSSLQSSTGKWRFHNVSLLKAFSKSYVFSDGVHPIRVEGKPIREKKKNKKIQIPEEVA